MIKTTTNNSIRVKPCFIIHSPFAAIFPSEKIVSKKKKLVKASYSFRLKNTPTNNTSSFAEYLKSEKEELQTKYFFLLIIRPKLL